MNPISERAKLAAWGWLASVLTGLCFFPALADKSFVPESAFFTALVIGLGIGLRALRTPALVVFVAELLALAELIVIRFGDDMRFGLIPTPTTLQGIEDVVRAGADTAQTFAAPAPSSPGLLLMVIFAVGLVAIFVDVLALGMGRVPLAGLPLLALYTIPVAALPTGVPFFAFVPGAAAYIAMLMADERDRLAHWGRLVSRNAAGAEQSQIDTSGLNATGRQVSLLALSAAVVLPIFMPALSSSILDGGRGTGEGTGDGTKISFLDPMVSLASNLKRKEEVPFLRISSDIAPTYLRLVVLANPGPNSWTADEVNLDDTISLQAVVLPPPTGLTSDVEQRNQSMTITLADDFPGDSAWLPTPYDLSIVNGQPDFAYVPGDQTLASRTEGAIQDVTSYQTDYATVFPTVAQLKAAGAAPSDLALRYGQVPGGVPDIVRITAEQVTAGATTDYEKALLLQSFFRDPTQFSYDLDAGYGYGYQAMAAFLDQRRGFCQHFAATMAMMARTLGIPSRVVVGFLSADEANTENEYVMTSHNVHAWPELYFEGVGWTRFEPTPGVNAQYPTWAPQETFPSNFTVDPTLGQSTGPTAATQAPASDVDTANPDAAAAGTGSGPDDPVISRVWLIALVLLVLLFLPAALRYSVRRARMTRPLEAGAAAEAAWLELRDTVRDLRLPWSGSMTPRARERALKPLLAGDGDGLSALNRLAIGVERARYSASVAAGANPAEDARAVIGAITSRADRVHRVRAFFWPGSLMPDIRRGWARLKAKVRTVTAIRHREA